jgi:xanthine dehydrogenase accessory factor
MEDVWICAERLLAEGRRICMATVVVAATSGPGRPGDKCLYDAKGFVSGTEWMAGEHGLAKQAVAALATATRGLLDLGEGGRVFLDVMTPGTHLLICGAGHIALPLARFGRELGFRVTVLDDRPDFAHADRFPGCRVVAQDFAGALGAMSLGPEDYVVVITRGHEHDVDCLTQVLGQPVAYVGMIGSRRRVRFVFQGLETQGHLREQLDRVFSPIGLPIGAESPEEIALSIAAELVLVRRKGAAGALQQRQVGEAQ